MTEWKHTRVTAGRVKPSCHAGAIFKHGREFPDAEFLVVPTDALLKIKDVMLASQQKDEADRQQQGRQHEERKERNKDVKKAFEKGVHESPEICVQQKG